MSESNKEKLLNRIAEALERLAPPVRLDVSLDSANAFVWHAEGEFLEPITHINRVDLSLLKGVDQVRALLYENTKRFANGLPANNALLWGARGMGKTKFKHGTGNHRSATFESF